MTSPLDADTPVATYLRELGASEEQVEQALASGVPSRLALDLVLSRNFTLTTCQLAERLDLPLGRVAEMIHAMGLPIADPDEPAFSEDDVELFRVSNMVGTDLAHVLASSLSRIADAGVATYLQNDPRLGHDVHEKSPRSSLAPTPKPKPARRRSTLPAAWDRSSSTCSAGQCAGNAFHRSTSPSNRSLGSRLGSSTSSGSRRCRDR